ncbi:hypothetical protein E3N88_21163 [Mikania micrantha]|uniref:COMM domain-containing protein n=1 Tax=Mikania micrantha TaxID=192012 RepID=A0A5N6NKP2_9ASTR|nr:hypothetical protein E3N88_21163 [Mikania micrantha]
MEHSLWGNLPVLIRANSKESVEFILQTLWRTRKVGLDSADRDVIRDLLQLQNDADLDPLLVCLRMLIRKCVYENPNKDEIQKLFPPEVLPEIQRLLTLLFQKFHKDWRQDISEDQVTRTKILAKADKKVEAPLRRTKAGCAKVAKTCLTKVAKDSKQKHKTKFRRSRCEFPELYLLPPTLVLTLELYLNYRTLTKKLDLSVTEMWLTR